MTKSTGTNQEILGNVHSAKSHDLESIFESSKLLETAYRTFAEKFRLNAGKSESDQNGSRLKILVRSRLVSPKYCEQLDSAFKENPVESLNRMLTCKSFDPYFSFSKILTPEWIKSQGVDYSTLGELMVSTIKKGKYLSPHPILQKKACLEDQTFADFLYWYNDQGLSPEQTLFSPGDYKKHHRDLLKLSDEEALPHYLKHGLFENRLKSLGVISSVHLPQNLQLRRQIEGLIRLRLASNAVVFKGKSIDSLPSGDVILFDKLSSVNAPGDLLAGGNDTEGSTDPGLLLDLYNTASLSNEGSLFVERDAPIQRVAVTDVEFVKKWAPSISGSVLYCVNLNGYDEIPILPEGEFEEFTKVLITDSMVDEKTFEKWFVIRPTIFARDVKRTCLWYKTHPHKLFPNATSSVWIDSNIILNPGAEGLIEAKGKVAEILTFAHPDRSCVYEELIKIRELKLDNEPRLQRAEKFLSEINMPKSGGLFETNVLRLKLDDLTVKKFLSDWWRFIFLYSRRDQLSFTAAAWINHLEVGRLDGQNSAKTSRYISKVPHISKVGRFKV